jgi:hypothetical protein
MPRASHSPKVAGSNPIPAMQKGPSNEGPFAHQSRWPSETLSVLPPLGAEAKATVTVSAPSEAAEMCDARDIWKGTQGPRQ